jgi:hypothetical protein
MWEINPREHQKFHGLGKNPAEFAEIESTYTREEAVAEAARCFRCDAETGSADYTVESRESIFAMARINPQQKVEQFQILDRRLEHRDNPFGEDHQATLDDLVFLPANLSRLVIDPYREVCKTRTDLGAIHSLELAIPFIVTGMDHAPVEVQSAYARSIREAGAAYLGVHPIGDTHWIQIIDGEENSAADAVAFFADEAMSHGIHRIPGNRPKGLIVNSGNVEQTIDFGLEQGLDFLILDATGGLPGLSAELAGAPDISIVNRAVTRLRELNREEEIDLVYFGGLRTGTDGAKMMALGAKAVIIGASAALSLGADISQGEPVYTSDLSEEERLARSANLLQAFNAEASMMARCTGKTNIQNMEPEDMRSITLAASKASGVPMAGSLNQY